MGSRLFASTASIGGLLFHQVDQHQQVGCATGVAAALGLPKVDIYFIVLVPKDYLHY
jgi:hypothetical protein